MAFKIILDAGHGGYDQGATYNGRREKDDALRLALAVGQILENNGFDVAYTRTSDVYQSPNEKARIGNQSGADLFVSFHRNSSPNPNTYSGIQTLIYSPGGLKEAYARAINHSLSNIGFADLGISIRPNLAVLRGTRMPAILIEAGFINTDQDNTRFDQDFDAIAGAIADAIMETAAQSNAQTPPLYRVQVGLFANYSNAANLLYRLQRSGYDGDIVTLGGLYAVLTGSFPTLEQANQYARELNAAGFETAIIAL